MRFCLALVMIFFSVSVYAEPSTEETPVLLESATGELPTVSEPEEDPNARFQDKPLEDVESIKIRYLKMADGTHYSIPDEPATLHERTEYETVVPELRERFHQRRLLFLQYAAQLLHRTRLGFGVGIMTKDKFVQALPSRDSLRHPIRTLVEKFRPRSEEEKAAMAAAKPAKVPTRKLGERAVQRILQGLNHTLWTHPALVANANEAGFSISAGASGGAMIGNKGKYAGMELGLAFGFNWEQKALTFDIFHDYENVNRLVGVAVKAGVNGKGQLHLRAVDRNHVPTSRGMMYYPPFSPDFMETAQSTHIGSGLQFALGTSGPLLPLPWVLYMDSQMTRVPWLRLGLRWSKQPLIIQGKLADMVKGAIHRVASTAALTAQTAVAVGAHVCVSAYNQLKRN